MEINSIRKDVIKSSNYYEILSTLEKYGPLSRKDIADQLKLTPAAITVLTNDLINYGILVEGDAITTKRSGRKKIEVKINKDFGYVLSVHLEATEMTITLSHLSNLYRESLWSKVVDLSEKRNIKGWELAQQIEVYTKECCESYNLNIQKICCIGVTCIGFVTAHEGVSENSFGLLSPNTNIEKSLQEIFGVPVYVENNVRALSVLEMQIRQNLKKESQQRLNGLFLKHGPGFGGTVIIDNEPFAGSFNHSGEIGHTKVQGNKEPCFCGKIGCLSTLIGRTALIKKVEEIWSATNTPYLWEQTSGFPQKITFALLLESAKQGDEPVVQLLQTAAEHMALSIHNTMMILDGEIVVVYGELFCDNWFFQQLNLQLDKCDNGQRRFVIARSLVGEQWKAPYIVALKKYLKYVSENIN